MRSDGPTAFRYAPRSDRGAGAPRSPGEGSWERAGARLLRGFGAYLATRPAESWLFFAAGFGLAVILT